MRATGDSRVEPNEWFEVNLSDAVGANVSIADATGIGTILNDDTTAFSVVDATVIEGDGLGGARLHSELVTAQRCAGVGARRHDQRLGGIERR